MENQSFPFPHDRCGIEVTVSRNESRTVQAVQKLGGLSKDGAAGWIDPWSYIYMSHRKNPGNTKYVLDGHWFMEIDGNC